MTREVTCEKCNHQTCPICQEAYHGEDTLCDVVRNIPEGTAAEA